MARQENKLNNIKQILFDRDFPVFKPDYDICDQRAPVQSRSALWNTLVMPSLHQGVPLFELDSAFNSESLEDFDNDRLSYPSDDLTDIGVEMTEIGNISPLEEIFDNISDVPTPLSEKSKTDPVLAKESLSSDSTV